ncbi:MAG: GNAT family N-acetyltransferase [Candidatus Marinimicrobia bacterium]|nr:GNAT family N-acetyltransferase [Candidatus Neomarinimicrobiota bacterium]
MRDLKPLQFETIRTVDDRILREFFYLALFVPPGEAPLPKSIIDEPVLVKYIENFGEKEGDLAVTAKDKKILGLVWGRKFRADKKGWGYVDDKTPEIGISVLPDYRNIGIGTVLLKQIFQAYRDIGIQAVSLSVDKRNPSLRLYEQTGFKIIGEEDNAFIGLKQL